MREHSHAPCPAWPVRKLAHFPNLIMGEPNTTCTGKLTSAVSRGEGVGAAALGPFQNCPERTLAREARRRTKDKQVPAGRVRVLGNRPRADHGICRAQRGAERPPGLLAASHGLGDKGP